MLQRNPLEHVTLHCEIRGTKWYEGKSLRVALRLPVALEWLWYRHALKHRAKSNCGMNFSCTTELNAACEIPIVAIANLVFRSQILYLHQLLVAAKTIMRGRDLFSLMLAKSCSLSLRLRTCNCMLQCSRARMTWGPCYLYIIFMVRVGLEIIKPDMGAIWLWVSSTARVWLYRDDVIRWKHFSRYWPFLWGIHRSPVDSPHRGQWRGALMFSLICS